ncbi:MAG: ATP-grasp domain-containing protein [Candidatus Omnitrophica bacterium]|nr:ATP-grasp domain-containing protein [Candidatus Omnitrophota bacterium]
MWIKLAIAAGSMRENRKIVIAAPKENILRQDVQDVVRCKNSIKGILLKQGWVIDDFWVEKKDFQLPKFIKERILNAAPYCVFNLFEGFSDDSEKEAEFARIMEETGVCFTGNPSYSLRICLDKLKVNDILRKNNINIPQGIFTDDSEKLDIEDLRFPVFIKPRFEDASVGIEEDSLVTKRENLNKVVAKRLKNFPRGLLIEEFIPGREFNVGFLGKPPYELAGISVMDYRSHRNLSPFLTYSSKWETSCRAFKILTPSCEEKIDDDLKGKIIDVASRTGKILGCRGYFRVDLREKEGHLFVLDVNPNPDINTDSGFMRQAYHKGYSYRDIVEKILKGAVSF